MSGTINVNCRSYEKYGWSSKGAGDRATSKDKCRKYAQNHGKKATSVQTDDGFEVTIE